MTSETKSFDDKSTFFWDNETHQCKLALFAGSSEKVTLDGLTEEGFEPVTLKNKELPSFDEDKDFVVVNPKVTLKYMAWEEDFVDPIVEQYGLTIPRWVFFLGLDHSHCKIDPAVFKRILQHVKRWTREGPEQLGQLAGFLPWTVEYQNDQAWNPETEEWEDSDEFDNPLAQPFAQKQGDCEDMARMTLLCFEQIPDTLCPLKASYCCCAVDTVIRQTSGDQLHSMCVCVPWVVLDQLWLPLAYRKSSKGGLFDLPLLVIESTDRTKTAFARSTQPYDKVSEWIHENLFTRDLSFPFADKSYRAQEYFKKFLTLYSPQLFQRTGVASWHILVDSWWGATLDQLVDIREILLEPRQEQVDLKQAQLFVDRCCPKLLDPQYPVEKGIETPLEAVPIYLKDKDQEVPGLAVVAREVVLGQHVAFVDTSTRN